MCQLTGQEVANASMYDGSTATTEAVLMAERLTGTRRVLVARSRASGISRSAENLREKSRTASGGNRIHRSGSSITKALHAALRDDVCAVVVQSPNFFGAIEKLRPLAEAAHAPERCWSTAIAEGVSLGVMKPPVEADIVAMEAQSFGLAPSYGGPFAGVIASKDKFVRQMPGRLGGPDHRSGGTPRIRADAGNARTTHSPRKGHVEYLHEPGAMCACGHRASDAARQRGLARNGRAETCPRRTSRWNELQKIPGVRRTFPAPFFNEFIVELPRSVKMMNAELLKEKIIGPFVLGSRLSGTYKARVWFA